MRKIIAVVVLTLALTGCAGINTSVFQGGSSLTASVTNPVTPRMLYDIENGLTVAVSGLLAYKNACISKVVPASCRDIIANLQVYTRKAKPILVRLRVFVRNNDQVNAIGAYNEVRGLLSAFQETAAAAGVK
jgi:hypothetical protein